MVAIPDGYQFYKYNPSAAGAAVFIITFAIATVYHAWRAWNYRAKFFIAFVLGGLLEFIGFIGRAASHDNEAAIGPYVIQNMFLLVAPALFAATIYMVLGRIIRLLHAEHHSVVKVTRLTKYFVVGDVCCFWAQGQGGGLQAVGKPLFTTLGRWIVVGGLILQVIIFCIFIVVAWKFHTRINSMPTTESANPAIPWRKHMRALYITSGLILIRNIVRVIEYLEGYDGWVISHEVMLFLFDAVPMILVFVTFAIWHPCDLLNMGTPHVVLPQDAELEAFGMEEARKMRSRTESRVQILGKQMSTRIRQRGDQRGYWKHCICHKVTNTEPATYQEIILL